LLEGYLKQDPQNAALLAEAVTVAVETGRVARGAELLANAPSLHDDAQVRHAAGVVALAQHRFDEAATIFEALIAGGIAPPAIRFNLAYALFRAGSLGRAQKMFEELLQDDAAPEETLAYVVRCRHHLGGPQAAAEAWDNAPQRFKSPRNAGVASLAFLDADRPAEAGKMAESALSDPASQAVEAMVTSGTLLLAAGDTHAALKLLEAAAAKAAGDGRVWSTLGMALLVAGDAKRARDALERACGLMPQHAGTWVTLAWSRIVAKDLQAAQGSFERALAIEPDSADAHGGLAVVHALLGRADDARREIESAFRLDPDALAAKYAQEILSGGASDRKKMEALALSHLRARRREKKG